MIHDLPGLAVQKRSCYYKGERHVAWKGGIRKHDGYILIYMPEHPSAIDDYIAEHRLIMEGYLQRYLDSFEIVHHINKIKNDNRIDNLELCTNQSHLNYHNNNISEERRKKWREAKLGKPLSEATKKKISEIMLLPGFLICGHKGWRKCIFCKQYDDPINLRIYEKNRTAFHRKCKREYEKRRKAKL